MNEKENQHDPENTADKEENPTGGGPQNAEQRFITMAKVVALWSWKGPRRPKRDSMHEDLLIR